MKLPKEFSKIMDSILENYIIYINLLICLTLK